MPTVIASTAFLCQQRQVQRRLFHNLQQRLSSSSSSSSHLSLNPRPFPTAEGATGVAAALSASCQSRCFVDAERQYQRYHHQNQNGRTTDNGNNFSLAALAVVAATATAYRTTRCEEEAKEGETKEKTKEDDPYANLPEEDEETDCSMCQTFRQGPCRPQWRKMERCMKDHTDEENGVVIHCMRYFNPHMICIQGYGNLYDLISLEMQQEIVRYVETETTKPSSDQTWQPKTIDWSKWIQFNTEEDGAASYKETIGTYDPKTTPLWKRLPPDVEPLLLPVTCQIPKMEEAGRMMLRLAYVLDQDGHLLGLSHNKEYSELKKEAKKGSDENNDDKETDETKPATNVNGSGDESSSSPDHEFEFNLLPGETKSVRVYAVYAEHPSATVTANEQPDKDNKTESLEDILLESPVYHLQDVLKQEKGSK